MAIEKGEVEMKYMQLYELLADKLANFVDLSRGELIETLHSLGHSFDWLLAGALDSDDDLEALAEVIERRR